MIFLRNKTKTKQEVRANFFEFCFSQNQFLQLYYLKNEIFYVSQYRLLIV